MFLKIYFDQGDLFDLWGCQQKFSMLIIFLGTILNNFCMRDRGTKIQVTLSKELAELVEKEIKASYSTKSAWFTKIISDFFEQKGREDGTRKKVIDLQIK